MLTRLLTHRTGGLEQLAKMCPKALRFPRRVRRLPDMNAKILSVSNHDCDQESVDSDDDLSFDAMKAVDGMYPFMVAAAMSHVPESKVRAPTFYVDSDESRKAHHEDLERKDLQSLRSIFGLLRKRPEVLQMYLDSQAAEAVG